MDKTEQAAVAKAMHLPGPKLADLKHNVEAAFAATKTMRRVAVKADQAAKEAEESAQAAWRAAGRQQAIYDVAVSAYQAALPEQEEES